MNFDIAGNVWAISKLGILNFNNFIGNIFSGDPMVKVVMIIAPENFRDEELLIPKRILENAGVEVVVASTKKGECKGMLGAVVNADITLDEINVDDYKAIMFVGGSGTPLIRREDKALELAREAYDKGILVTAICWAPTTLAKAGILKGKKATVWLGHDPEYNMTTDKVLEKFGAEFVDSPVVVEEGVITANGPRAAEAYGQEVLKHIL